MFVSSWPPVDPEGFAAASFFSVPRCWAYRSRGVASRQATVRSRGSGNRLSSSVAATLTVCLLSSRSTTTALGQAWCETTSHPAGVATDTDGRQWQGVCRPRTPVSTAEDAGVRRARLPARTNGRRTKTQTACYVSTSPKGTDFCDNSHHELAFADCMKNKCTIQGSTISHPARSSQWQALHFRSESLILEHYAFLDPPELPARQDESGNQMLES